MQKNGIKNAKFTKCKGDEIAYFEGQGYYLGQKVSGYNTCVAIENYPYAITQNYLLPLECVEKKVLLFGYTMRALSSEEVLLVVRFFDEDGKEIGHKEKEVTAYLRSYYTPIMEKFFLPKTCTSVKVGLTIGNKSQGLSFFAPTVYVL